MSPARANSLDRGVFFGYVDGKLWSGSLAGRLNTAALDPFERFDR